MKLEVSDTQISTPPGTSELVPLIYRSPESLEPDHINSETLVSLVSWVTFPVFKSSKLHHEDVAWVSQEYSEVENSATSYRQLAADNDQNTCSTLTPEGLGIASPRLGAAMSSLQRDQYKGKTWQVNPVATNLGVRATAETTSDPRADH